MANSNQDFCNGGVIHWKVSPPGMFVGVGDIGYRGGHCCGCEVGPSLIKIKVTDGAIQREVHLPSFSSFGKLKRIFASETGLQPRSLRLYFMGKERQDTDILQMAGVTNYSSVILVGDETGKDSRVEAPRRINEMSAACKAVAIVRAEVDKLSEKIALLESRVSGGTKVAEKEFIVLAELLMVQLLKLDSIKAEGETKLQRKSEVNRIQGYVNTVDFLKATSSCLDCLPSQ